MLGEEQKLIPEAQPKDAGAEARASDIIEALVQTKAWQDAEHKAAAEAEHLDDTKAS